MPMFRRELLTGTADAYDMGVKSAPSRCRYIEIAIFEILSQRAARGAHQPGRRQPSATRCADLLRRSR